MDKGYLIKVNTKYELSYQTNKQSAIQDTSHSFSLFTKFPFLVLRKGFFRGKRDEVGNYIFY